MYSLLRGELCEGVWLLTVVQNSKIHLKNSSSGLAVRGLIEELQTGEERILHTVDVLYNACHCNDPRHEGEHTDENC